MTTVIDGLKHTKYLTKFTSILVLLGFKPCAPAKSYHFNLKAIRIPEKMKRQTQAHANAQINAKDLLFAYVYIYTNI